MSDEDYETVPPETPSGYGYIRTKAQRYLTVGPDVYRDADFFHMPPADWGTELLRTVEAGFRQVVDWCGITPGKPFTGLGNDGFCAMLAVVHFEPRAQQPADAGNCLDRMLMCHRVTGQEIVLYNRLPTPRAPGRTGLSYEDAIIVEADSEMSGVGGEYEFVARLHGRRGEDWDLVMQSLNRRGGRRFDVLHISTNDGRRFKYYFDVTSFFGKV